MENDRSRIDALWSQATANMSWFRTFTKLANQSSGFGLGGDPITRVRESKFGNETGAFLNTVSEDDLMRLRARARFCEQNMMAKVRLMLVANITLPVSVLFLINQFAPGGLWALIQSFHLGEWLNGQEVWFFVGCFAFAISITLGMILFAIVRARAFEDLKLIIELESSDRGLDLAESHAAGGAVMADMDDEDVSDA